MSDSFFILTLGGEFKQSGYGHKYGWERVRCFMQTKSVFLVTDTGQPDPFAG